MWAAFKRAAVGVAGVALVAGASPGFTQITSSGPLRQVDPWGVGWLGRSEGALPSTLWDGASAIRMADLLSQIDAAALSPASADLLRRTLLSSGKGPTGADAALTEARIRLLQSLGEGERAVDLKLRFPQEDWAAGGEDMRVDRDLAAGRLGAACAEADASDSERAFWLKLRALCYAAAGELAAAELSLELARSDGVDDSWLRTTLGSLNAPDAPKPVGDYSSGLHTEASILAGAPPADNAMEFADPDIAAKIAMRADAPEDLRIQAAFDAAVAGKLSISAARDLLIRPAPAEDDPGDDDNVYERSALEQASARIADPMVDIEGKAAGLVGVLDVEGQSIGAFRLAARLLAPELKQIPQTTETRPYAETFARATLIAGDFDAAQKWRAAMEPPPPPEPEPVQVLDIGLTDTQGAIELLPAAGDAAALEAPIDPGPAPEPPFVYPEWTKARLDALLLISGADFGELDAENVALRLVAHMDSSTRDDTVRLLHVFAAFGKATPSEARETLAASDAGVGKPIGYGELAAIQSAAVSGILGEASLAAIAAFGDDPAAVEAGGFGAVISILASAGLEDDARALALEALSPQDSL